MRKTEQIKKALAKVNARIAFLKKRKAAARFPLKQRQIQLAIDVLATRRQKLQGILKLRNQLGDKGTIPNEDALIAEAQMDVSPVVGLEEEFQQPVSVSPLATVPTYVWIGGGVTLVALVAYMMKGKGE